MNHPGDVIIEIYENDNDQMDEAQFNPFTVNQSRAQRMRSALKQFLSMMSTPKPLLIMLCCLALLLVNVYNPTAHYSNVNHESRKTLAAGDAAITEGDAAAEEEDAATGGRTGAEDISLEIIEHCVRARLADTEQNQAKSRKYQHKQQWTKIIQIGEGNSTNVDLQKMQGRKARETDNLYRAVKMIKPPGQTLASDASEKHIKELVAIDWLKRMKVDYTMEVYDWWKEVGHGGQEMVCIATENLPNGNLVDNPPIIRTEEALLKYLAKLGLEYGTPLRVLTKKGLRDSDLRPMNIMTKSGKDKFDWTIVKIDHGRVSKTVDAEQQTVKDLQDMLWGIYATKSKSQDKILKINEGELQEVRKENILHKHKFSKEKITEHYEAQKVSLCLDEQLQFLFYKAIICEGWDDFFRNLGKLQDES